jgi:type I restriction enzyme M protein
MGSSRCDPGPIDAPKFKDYIPPLVFLKRLSNVSEDELLNREVFYTLAEAKILIEQWRKEYNVVL